MSRNYGCSVVFCTATQPAVGKRPGFDIGLDSIQEIIPDPPKLYEALRRVHVQDIGALSDADLVKRLHEHRQVLCVVNTRKHARILYDLLGESPANFHLSALLYPAHRTVVLDAIHQRIDADEPCIVVSTQLVEAGVDIDFPVGYRSLAGIDSIAQAAGRCNRNGRKDVGHTFVFRTK